MHYIWVIFGEVCKMSSRSNFVKVDSQYFIEGMYIGTNVYTIQGRKVILLCSDAILTPELKFSIKRYTAKGQGIYVKEADYKGLIAQAKKFAGEQEAIRVNKEYKVNKKRAEDIIAKTRQNKLIPKAETEVAVKDVSKQIKNTEVASLLQCINAMRSVDEYLYTHSINVSILNGLMAKWLHLDQINTSQIIEVGLLHDIGKINMPDEILNKPGKLTEEEFEIIKEHPVFSEKILIDSGVEEKSILQGVRNHHEKVNGTGYPDGLHMKDISLFARVTAISDIYDAMVAERAYKHAVSPFVVLAEFTKEKFSDLDIELVDLLLKNMPLELTGKKVLLTNGKIGEVIYVNPSDYEHPMVCVDGENLLTDDKIKCVSMYSEP